jgi:hypothetical protein
MGKSGDSRTGDGHLIKLCVGAEAVEDLTDWQATARAKGPDGLPRHVTRMWPKRADEVLNGGSLYWVFKGLVLCRQRILRLDEVDRARRHPALRDRAGPRGHPRHRRPRNARSRAGATSPPGDAPRDLRQGRAEEDALPPSMQSALAEIGVL